MVIIRPRSHPPTTRTPQTVPDFRKKPLHDAPVEFLRHSWFWLFVTPADLAPLVAHDAAKIAFVGEYEFVPYWRWDAIVAVMLSFGPTVAGKRCEFTDNEVAACTAGACMQSRTANLWMA